MSMTSQQHQAELHKKLWDMANSLRGQMEASEFKNYILGLIFYRYLSQNVEATVELLLKNEAEDTSYAQAWDNVEMCSEIRKLVIDELGYTIDYPNLFSNFISQIHTESFELETLQAGINNINNLAQGTAAEGSLDNLFDDLDLNSSKLGRTISDRTVLIGKIIEHINDIPFDHKDSSIDVLGDAYEFLIGRFASTAGKSAGEFYTPQQVSTILARVVTANGKSIKSVYDPTCGSGSLLLRVARELKDSDIKLYGQELTSATYNLARMNMMLHGVNYNNFDIKNENTLTMPQHLGKRFDAIVANPPYSAHWNPDTVQESDERFSDYAKKAPKTKADYAFVQHMLAQLSETGTAAVVLPHGVLFRGAAEGSIRQQIIENNWLDAVIGLPANIFFGTSIPTCILVFKKCRKDTDPVFIIDASQEFEKGKNANTLRDIDVDKIVSTYSSRNEVDKFSRKIDVKEIESNGYNLNIPRYIDSTNNETLIDIQSVNQQLADIQELEVNLSERISTIISKSLKSLTPLSVFVKKFHGDIMETAPTLESAIIAHDGPTTSVLLYTGENVESEFFESYPTQFEHLRTSFENLLKYLNADSYVIRLTKECSAELFYNVTINEWVSIDDKESFHQLIQRLRNEPNYDKAWNSISEQINDVPTKKFGW